MKNTKKVILCICIIMIFTAIPVFADESQEPYYKFNGPSVRFSYFSVFYNALDIKSNGRAEVSSSVSARNADKIKISTYLKRYEDGRWILVKNWTSTTTDNLCVNGGAYYVPKGYQYKITSYAYAYIDDVIVESTKYTSDSTFY